MEKDWEVIGYLYDRPNELIVVDSGLTKELAENLASIKKKSKSAIVYGMVYKAREMS